MRVGHACIAREHHRAPEELSPRRRCRRPRCWSNAAV